MGIKRFSHDNYINLMPKSQFIGFSNFGNDFNDMYVRSPNLRKYIVTRSKREVPVMHPQESLRFS